MEIKTLEGIPCYLGTWRLEAALFRSYFISTSRRSTFVLAFCVLSMLQNYQDTDKKVATDYIRLSMGRFAFSDPSPTLLCILQPCANKGRLISSNVLSVMWCQEWAGTSKSEVLAHFWKCPCYYFYCDTWWVPIWNLSGITIKFFKTKNVLGFFLSCDALSLECSQNNGHLRVPLPYT